MRHDLQTIGTSAAQIHEIYPRSSRHWGRNRARAPRGLDVGPIQELWRAYGHLKNTTDLEREYLQEMVDLFQTRVSAEVNRFVRRSPPGAPSESRGRSLRSSA